MEQILIKCNVGPSERTVRLLLGGAAMAGVFMTRKSRLKPLLTGLGLFGIVTSALRYCPINHALGINNGQAAYRAFPHYLRRI